MKAIAAAASTTLLASPWTAALAQADYPNKPIRLLVPFGPGSTPDVFARTVSEHASRTLGQSIVIENRAGAGGNVATNQMAKAAPDGYTIGVSITGPLVNNTLIYDNLPYDPFKDLQPITFGVHQGNVLAVSSALGVNSMKELMALLRANPGKYNYASVGVGTLSQLSVEAIKALTNSYVVQVPYASSPAAVMSVLQGDTHMVSLAPLAVMPQVQAGKMKVLAVSTARRLPQLPDVPTFRESGVALDGSAWIGIVGPAGMPAPVVARLNQAFVGAMRDPAVLAKLRAQYMEPEPGTPEQFAAYMREERAKWGPVIKRAGIKAE
ncbi:tripartite tricarboxylate transporter substrate binding protein [Ramlibacter sp. HM2]|uniref:Tripartite tricarboxylate transporter substrate binding protein n=1 Tax=Ramlibacter pallidus TaxID=2780087 RepID=A0ABR9S582_9BURK|nr:tripartite tricarboxylate transporter substrate binding protein [Ramlibacter pallidus]